MAGVGQLITEVGPVKLNAGQTFTTSTEAMFAISPCRPAELHTFANFEAYLSYLCLRGKGTRSKLPQTACQRYWSCAFHSTCATKLLSAPQHRHVSLAEDTEWRHHVAGISGHTTEFLQCSCPSLLVSRGRSVRSGQRTWHSDVDPAAGRERGLSRYEAPNEEGRSTKGVVANASTGHGPLVSSLNSI